MSQKHIATLITTIDTIPPLPEISAAVMKALNAEEVAIVEVGDLIEKDIALTSQILKVANSPAFGASNTIGNIHHAIMMLGLDEVRALLLAFAVEKFFSTEAKDTALRKGIGATPGSAVTQPCFWPTIFNRVTAAPFFSPVSSTTSAK